jgi:phosphate-selective porin OprO/OprP
LSEDNYERWWDYATLYERADNDVLQTLSLSGRLQAETAYFDASQGDYDDAVWRRSRLGFKARLYRNWVIHIEGDFDLNSDAEDSYTRLTDAYIGWSPESGLKVKVLKQSAGFTLDGATSSKNLLTLQRSNLTNNLWFTAEYFTGVTLASEIGSDWSYKAGIFSSDGNENISEFDASYFGLLSLTHSFGGQLDIDEASIRIDYVYNDEDVNSNTRDFSSVLSLVSQWQSGSKGLWTDLSAGRGYADQSNLWGITLMPFYDFNQHLQAVLRYTYMSSSEENGIRLGRYENKIASGLGDKYEEIYAGFNVFFYGHKMKWQTGLQYTSMDDSAHDGGDYEGWGVTTGLRLSW